MLLSLVGMFLENVAIRRSYLGCAQMRYSECLAFLLDSIGVTYVRPILVLQFPPLARRL